MVLQVCLLVIAQGYLGIAMRISATMMKRGHLKETAKVSRYLVAAGHSDFKKCLDGEVFQLHALAYTCQCLASRHISRHGKLHFALDIV